MSQAIAKWLGRWPVCIVFGVIATIMFTWAVPHGVATITANRTIAPLILDEYYPTWTPDNARHLYAALGATGRARYQHFYLTLDFWFPVLSLCVFYAAMLSLAFPPGRRGAWVNLLPIAMWACDAAENLNHFTMAASYPQLPSAQLAFGPALTLVKYMLITGLPILALAGFALRLRVLSRTEA